MKKKIHFLWETEKRIKVTQAGREGSFFYEAYQQALAGVSEIVRASLVYTDPNRGDPFFLQDKSEGKEGYDLSQQEDKYFYNYPNNMIVFSGDRGTGKSSAMLTFANSLKNQNSQLFSSAFLKGMAVCKLPRVDSEKVAAMLKGCEFVSLPPIDPTTLEKGNQILVVLLARMFQMAQDIWEEQGKSLIRSTEQEQINRKNKLMKRFSTCYEHICAIKNLGEKRSEYEGLDVLADLGDGSRLKREFADLVDDLLRFRCPNSAKEPYLILQIDDTDMNIENAYSILEDIRKYLVIPRVIIIMAANLTHLKKVVESSLLGSYHQKMERSADYAKNIAQQYITKLFPQTRQITLPDLGTYFKEHADNLEIWYETPGEPVLPEQKESDNGKKEPSDFQDPQEQIFRLIYQKTGLIFLKQENLLHYIIPGNMRLHAHFLSMLVQMENVENADSVDPQFFISSQADEAAVQEHRRKLRVRLQNILRFRDYFLTTWVTNNLSEEYANLIRDLVEIDVSKKVRFVCMHLWRKCTTDDRDGVRHEALSEGQYNYGNMVWLCRRFEELSLDEGDRRLVFAIQTYFALLGHSIVLEELIEFYDQLKPSEAEWSMCSLERLYPLYGSRIFPYSSRIEHSEQKTHPLETGGQILEESDFIHYVPLSQTGSDEKIKLATYWNPGEIATPENLKLRDTIGMLYSMFANYMNVDDPLLDLCSLIINCLYIRKGRCLEVSPAVKGKPWSRHLAEALNLDEKEWMVARNSALLTVLNWDVQERVGQKLTNAVKQAEKRSINDRISFSDWGGILEKFYMSIVPLFISPDNNHGPAIAALGKLEFSGCVKSLLKMTNEEINGIKDWDAVSGLNPYVTAPQAAVSSTDDSPKTMTEEKQMEEEEPKKTEYPQKPLSGTPETEQMLKKEPEDIGKVQTDDEAK